MKSKTICPVPRGDSNEPCSDVSLPASTRDGTFSLEKTMSIRSILAEDSKLVTYRPSLRKLIPSVTGVILFQQILYWYEKQGQKFYKFTSPCGHELYKEGDSWEEEIAFSAKEIRTALDSFAFKCGKKNKELLGDAYKEAKANALVLYYTDANRVTWYSMNCEVVEKALRGIYLINSHRSNIKESDQSAITLNTETTAETTTNNNTEEMKQNSKPISKRSQSKVVDAAFERCWACFNRYGVKAQALRYWKKLKQEEKDAIEKIIPVYMQVVKEGRYQKQFEGWINARQWEMDWHSMCKTKPKQATNNDSDYVRKVLGL